MENPPHLESSNILDGILCFFFLASMCHFGNTTAPLLVASPTHSLLPHPIPPLVMKTDSTRQGEWPLKEAAGWGWQESGFVRSSLTLL